MNKDNKLQENDLTFEVISYFEETSGKIGAPYVLVNYIYP